ncbi:MAG TPA: FRG domain-containing protein [Terriglobales bacterium]|nr:FRG domain-containing protein [Terriglobales bacterium]
MLNSRAGTRSGRSSQSCAVKRDLLATDAPEREGLRLCSSFNNNSLLLAPEASAYDVGMNGQWLGRYSGTTSGAMIVNIDERHDFYRGAAYLIEDDRKLPDSLTGFQTVNKESPFEFRTEVILPLDPINGAGLSLEELKKRYGEDEVWSKYADVKGTVDRDSLNMSWVTDTGVIGECVLPRSKADQPSELIAQYRNWDEFRQYVSGLKESRFLFRGQNKPWRLRTSFHRSGRADLARYLNEDVPALYKHLSARTRHVFNRNDPDENGAFFNLIQHHGYPTPLLDWTYSPYVAAFFAYRGISNEQAASAEPNAKVRIHIFDQEQWKKDVSQILFVVAPRLNLSIGEFLAIENERMIPQQAASTITNVDDIEDYINSMQRNGTVYLWAIDLPVNNRRQVVRDLTYMGITAGSLFPGLDGACEELKERNFEI